MRPQASPKRPRIFWCFFALFLVSGIGLNGQERKINWNDVMKAARTYFGYPSTENVLEFFRSLPEAPAPDEEWVNPVYDQVYWYIFENLSVLEKQVLESNRNAIKAAFRLYTLAEGRLWEELDIMLGDLIRVDPELFLEEFKCHPLGVDIPLRYGWIVCDGRRLSELEAKEAAEDVCEELGMRAKALGTVQNHELLQLRDECINVIEGVLSKKKEFMSSYLAGTLSSNVLGEFLSSPYLKAQRMAFDHIISHRDEFLPAVLKNLQDWRALHNSRTDHLDRLLYLAAIFREESLQGPLEQMIREREFLNDCIYDCPLVFALIMYGYFEGWQPPIDLEYSLSIIKDVVGGIAELSRLTLKREDPRNYIKGPGINSYLDETVKLGQEELIRRADPSNPLYADRLAAAFTLEYTMDNSKNLNDLYWLAILTESADFEYRMSIYRAIYRAEIAKLAGKSKKGEKYSAGVSAAIKSS